MSRESAFEDFARAATPRLYRSARFLAADPHTAEDLVQETLAKVYVRWMRRLAAPLEQPQAYAHRTLVRTYLSARRKRSSTERPAADLPDAGTSDGDHDLRLALTGALATLAPLDRAVLVLRFLDDLSVAETAERLSLSEGAVRNRSMRALGRIRELLGASLPDLMTQE